MKAAMYPVSDRRGQQLLLATTRLTATVEAGAAGEATATAIRVVEKTAL